MTTNTHSFIVWHDSLSGEPNMVECLSYESWSGAEPVDSASDESPNTDGTPNAKHESVSDNDNASSDEEAQREAPSVKSPPLGVGDFVVIEDPDQKIKWMAQVVEPQRNLPLQGLSRESPSAVAVFERILKGEINKSIFLNQVYYYRLQLIGEIGSKGRLSAVRRRPRAGSLGGVAAENAVRLGLDLPAVFVKDGLNTILGRIHSTQIPIAADWSSFKQHILVAGATGSGKSNTVANLIKAAQAHNACVIVYDQKPDYQHAASPNDEKHLFKSGEWNEAFVRPFGLDNVSRFTLYQGSNEGEEGEELIAIRARDVPRNMLISAIFHYPDEGNQRDVFGALLDFYASQHKNWTLQEFAKWVIDARKPQPKGPPQLVRIAEANGWGTLNDMTLDAMQRKMDQRRMSWLDALESPSGVSRGGIFAKSDGGSPAGTGVNTYFEPKKHIAAGKVLVIRTNASGREYGLFLTYMLRTIYDLKRDGSVSCPIVNIVDEAQDIFTGETTGANAAGVMSEIIRKGRSRDIAFVVAAQSVSQVPDAVLTNMNTRIIHRQNSIEELRRAIPSASREVMASSLTFGPGEALASIIGARSVVHAQMAPSPFELTKVSAEKRTTLADQDESATEETLTV